MTQSVILDFIECLPDPLRTLWNDCDSCFFDYGFMSGFQRPTFIQQISSDLIVRIGACGGTIQITIYPDDEQR